MSVHEQLSPRTSGNQSRQSFDNVALQSLAGSRLPAFAMAIGDYLKDSKIVGALRGRSGSNGNVLSLINPTAVGTIVVAQGALSSLILRDLVELCKADPELLQYHFSSSRVFPMSSLPSRPKPFATIRFITIGAFAGTQSPCSSYEDETDLETQFARQLAEHHNECLRGDRIGFECFRAINLHGRSFFTVEQQATFFPYAVSETEWSGVFLSDIGRQSGLPPWSTRRKNFQEARFLSVGSSDLDSAQSDEAIRSPAGPRGSRTLSRPNPFLARAHDDSALSIQDQRLCIHDPFVFAVDLFDTSALCWMQALSFLRDAFQHPREEADIRTKLLSRDKVLIDRAMRYFIETLRFIDSRDNFGWPKCHEEADIDRVTEIAKKLRQDFEVLRQDAAELSFICKESITIAMNETRIKASQQGLLEGKRVQIITYLAFAFLPLTLIASIFGMNVKEINPGSAPSISLYFMIALILTLFSMVVPMWIEFKGTGYLRSLLKR